MTTAPPTPLPTALPTAPARRKVSREDVVRLGRSGKPWAFLPLAAQVLRVTPGDHLVCVLMASNLAALGLGGPARGLIESLPEGVRADPDVAALAGRIEGLADERIGTDEVVGICRANVAAMAESMGGLAGPIAGSAGVLAEALAEWETRAGQIEWMRSRDGNIVRRGVGSLDLTTWLGLGDLVGAAKTFSTDYFVTEKDTNDPLTIEGMDPPWILREALAVFGERADGYVRRIRVVQADVMEMLDGLGQLDLSEALSGGQVELIAGPGCDEVFRERLMASRAYRVQGPYVPLATLRKSVEPSLKVQLGEARRAQEDRHASLSRQLEARYADRDGAWWRDRYEEATSGGKPLRVLVTTCLFSTFVQHSSRDLVGAIRRSGHEAELLIEPDKWTHLSSVAYLEAVHRQDPDLIVLINYTRQNMGQAFPGNVPFVTWIQDAMPHLFDKSVGSAMGPFDFLAGHLLEELFSKFAYPLARLIPTPVVADSEKFHPEPVSDALREEHACEIAFVSHHSETPRQMHDRLRGECSGDARLARAVDGLYDEVCEAAGASGHEFMFTRLREASERELAREMGSDATPGFCARFLRTYCMPMADRILRHETLRWAAELAEKRGWRLHLYGRGWEGTEEFSQYARGELAHGEALRASYQAAAVQLHMSAHTAVHQRVMECALSGGMPLCRLVIDELGTYRGRALRAAALRCEPTGHNEVWDVPEFVIGEHAELMAVAAQYQRLGLAYRDVGAVSEKRLRMMREQSARDASRHNVGWLLGDLSETTFRSRDDLERLVERALGRPAWKRDIVEGIAGRVRAETTHDGLFSRMAQTVKGSFAEHSA